MKMKKKNKLKENARKEVPLAHTKQLE